jgi:hypothetical protein
MLIFEVYIVLAMNLEELEFNGGQQSNYGLRSLSQYTFLKKMSHNFVKNIFILTKTNIELSYRPTDAH